MGYKTIGGRLVIDEEKAATVKYAFEEYAKGTPKKDIIAELNARGLRNKNGKPYGLSAFQKALQCEKYIGVLDQAGVRIENACPAIIDVETFEKVQARIKSNKRMAGKQKATAEYLLSGKLYCGHCGSPMQGVSGTGKSGNRWYYYQCAKRRKHECDKKHEKKDFLEWYVVEQTVEYVLMPDRMAAISKAVVELYNKEFNYDKIKELEKRIAKYERDIDKYTESLLDAPRAAYNKIFEKIEAADAAKCDLEIDLAKLKIANKIRYTEDDINIWLKSFCRGDLFDHEFRRRIIDVFINTIYLYDDKVVIYYNIKSGKQVSYIEMLDSIEDESEPEVSDSLNGVRIPNAVVEARGVEPL